MKIIKPGKSLDELFPPVRFECERCGCIFEEELDNCYKPIMVRNLSFIACKCPNCGKNCFKEKW